MRPATRIVITAAIRVWCLPTPSVVLQRGPFAARLAGGPIATYFGGAADPFEGNNLCGPCADAARMQFELETSAADLDLLTDEDAFERALESIVASHAQSAAGAL
jgi:hypothetical protein